MIAYMYKNDDGETAAISLTKDNDVIVAVFKAGDKQDVLSVEEALFDVFVSEFKKIDLEKFSTMESKGNMDTSNNHIILTKEVTGQDQKIGMYSIPLDKTSLKLKKWISNLKRMNSKK